MTIPHKNKKFRISSWSSNSISWYVSRGNKSGDSPRYLCPPPVLIACLQLLNSGATPVSISGRVGKDNVGLHIKWNLIQPEEARTFGPMLQRGWTLNEMKSVVQERTDSPWFHSVTLLESSNAEQNADARRQGPRAEESGKSLLNRDSSSFAKWPDF